MILSMTGYGRHEMVVRGQRWVVEIKGLNSKTMDISLRMPAFLREKEIAIRTLLTEQLERGRVDLFIYPSNEQDSDSATLPSINETLFYHFYEKISAIYQRLNIARNEQIVPLILRLPNVIQQDAEMQLQDTELVLFMDALQEAIHAFIDFRKQDGMAIERTFEKSLAQISELLASIDNYEKERLEKIYARLRNGLESLCVATETTIDENRLEQEMIYYLEKLDISEEKVRLKNHIDYFRQTCQEANKGIGKKLGFIAQEMGREINTLGSKSNHSEMQILVVQMKDILEQIKEQILNVL